MMRFDRWRLAPLFALVWPIVFFGDRVFPYRGTIAVTENDFIQLYWAYKAYLLDCLAHGRFPLWSPSEGAGYPFHASPFTQAFYPLNLPLAAFYALAGGYSPHDHQVFTALGNGLFALGTYLWLRSLGNGAPAALLAACLVSASFRFGDMLRFPNAVHTALWYPWILLSFNRIFAARRGWELARWLAALGGFLVAFLTAGYPYYVYYSIFLFPPYLLLAAAGGLGGVPPASRRRLGLIAATSALAAAVCAPYLANVKQALDSTVGRTAGAHHPWYVFGPIDSINSLLFPVGASPEGCNYFGAAGLFLLVLYVAGIAGDPDARAERRLCMILIGWCLLVSYISLGPGSLLFGLLERTLPGFSRLRGWARLSVIQLPVLGWLLARAFEHFQARLAEPVAGAAARRRKAAKVLLGALLVIVALQCAQLYAGYVHRFYTVYLTNLRGLAAWTVLGTLLAYSTLRGLIAVAGRRHPAGVPPAVAVALLLAVSAIDVWPVGARLWSFRDVRPKRIPFDVAAVVRRSPSIPRRALFITLSLVDPGRPEKGLSPAFNVGLIAEWYFQRYFDFVLRSRGEPAELEYLLGGIDGRRLFLSTRMDHARIRPFLDDCLSFGGAFTIIDYTGDRMEAEVTMPADGFVTFVDNWDPDWRVLVDGAPTAIGTAFGTFKAVAVPAGVHRVVFEYVPRLWPWSFVRAHGSTELPRSRAAAN